MSQLSEVITKESVERLHKAFVDGMELAQADASGKHFGINSRIFGDVGEPIVRWVHHKLMESARLEPNPPNKAFPYHATVSISDILRKEGIDIRGGSVSSTYGTRIVGDIGRVLKYNGLMFNSGYRGKGGTNSLWIKPWDPALDIQQPASHWKPDYSSEKRIIEESDKPVRSRIDLRSFKVPEPKPDKILEFIQRFVPAALKVQDQLTDTRQALLEAQTRIMELESQINDQAETQQWEGVTDELASLLNGEVGGGSS